jgi:hypothetical protein
MARADRYRSRRTSGVVDFEPLEAVSEEQLVVRLPSRLLAQIDAEAGRMSAAHPGLSVSRSDAVRALLLRGLASSGE